MHFLIKLLPLFSLAAAVGFEVYPTTDCTGSVGDAMSQPPERKAWCSGNEQVPKTSSVKVLQGAGCTVTVSSGLCMQEPVKVYKDQTCIPGPFKSIR